MTTGIGYLVGLAVAAALAVGCSSDDTPQTRTSSTGSGGTAGGSASATTSGTTGSSAQTAGSSAQTTGSAGGSAAQATGGAAPVSPAGYTCQAGQTLCGDSCVFVENNPLHCGGCNHACPVGTSCVGGICSCQAGLSSCNGQCVDLTADAANCGACGVVCVVGEVCSLSACSSSCAAGLTQCEQACFDLATSLLNCGSCGNACAAGRLCQSGVCACATGTDCSGQCVDTVNDPANCGACGTVCAAGQTCSAGICVGATANTGGSAGATAAVGGSAGATIGIGGAGGAVTVTGGAAGAVGAGGAAGAAPTGPADGLDGVWLIVDDAGTEACVPFCSAGITATDAEYPDWGWDVSYSCIIPGSTTALANLACVTGGGAPEPRTNLPGVVVGTDDAGTLGCVPICTTVTTVDDGGDWGWEFNATCIVPGSFTADCNQACTTGHPLPDPLARPGVTIDAECVALCECSKNPDTDAEYPDWSWEYNATCVMVDSESSTGNPECTTTDIIDYTPPALTGTKVADGFYTSSGRLYDAYGNEFIIRGVNNPHIWFDGGNEYLAYQALDTIASYGTNTVRVVWETSGSATLLAQILFRIVELQMVPMVELHDATGSSSDQELLQMAQYYTQADVSQVLLDFREYLLVNIANEWSGNNFSSAYQAAISELRGAGINHTLVIDANEWGQNANAIFDNHAALTSADPEGNLLFSVHMYGNYGSAAAVDSVLNQANSSSIPLIVGEFGPQLSGATVAWQQILATCTSLGIGYIPWSWKGNGSPDEQLDMAQDWTGPLTSWGQDAMTSANGVANTAQRASIFQ